jgi:ribose transport system substrate-binding protein
MPIQRRWHPTVRIPSLLGEITMMGLDQDRMPVRSTLVTSVASGLIVAVILKAFSTGMANSAVLMWFALSAVGVAAAAWFAGSALLRIHKRHARAFVMTSAFSQKYYLAEFVQRMHSSLDHDGIDLVLKVPDRDYDASALSRHLRRLLERRHDYIGGVIMATEVHRLRDDLVMFCRRSRLPLVFTDIEPFDEEHEYPENTAYIGYDTGQLGELAGRWLVRKLRDKTRPQVLIIASHEHSARQQHCEQILRSALPDVSITTNDGCEFNRSRAYDAVRAHIRQLDAAHRLDAIFCTNDEMALGAVDALSSLPSPTTDATIVIGIDGVLEARALIDTGNSPLRATVVQNTQRLAGSIAELLQRMRGDGPVKKRTILDAEIHEAT